MSHHISKSRFVYFLLYCFTFPMVSWEPARIESAPLPLEDWNILEVTNANMVCYLFFISKFSLILFPNSIFLFYFWWTCFSPLHANFTMTVKVRMCAAQCFPIFFSHVSTHSNRHYVDKRKLLDFLEWEKWRVWDFSGLSSGGSVCEVTHGWTHALATLQKCFPQKNISLSFAKIRISVK